MRERTIRGGLSVPEGGDETIGSVRAELGVARCEWLSSVDIDERELERSRTLPESDGLWPGERKPGDASCVSPAQT